MIELLIAIYIILMRAPVQHPVREAAPAVESNVQAAHVQLAATPTPIQSAPVTGSLLHLVNDERIKAGVPPVSELGALNAGAGRRAKYLKTSGQWSHSYVTQHMAAALGYPKEGHGGENLARNFDSEGAVIIGWLNSPAHKREMLKPEYIYGGTGYYGGIYVLWLSTAYK